MTIKKFPSEEFPQIPSVEMNVHEGWKSQSFPKINGLSWKVEEFAYINKEVGAIAQLIAVSFITINDTKFMINFTGTTKLIENEKNEDYEKIQEMLGSIKVNENQ